MDCRSGGITAPLTFVVALLVFVSAAVLIERSTFHTSRRRLSTPARHNRAALAALAGFAAAGLLTFALHPPPSTDGATPCTGSSGAPGAPGAEHAEIEYRITGVSNYSGAFVSYAPSPVAEGGGLAFPLDAPLPSVVRFSTELGPECRALALTVRTGVSAGCEIWVDGTLVARDSGRDGAHDSAEALCIAPR